MSKRMKILVAVIGIVAAGLASVVSAVELTRPMVRAEVEQILREADLATQRDIDRVLSEIRELRVQLQNF